LSFEALQPNQFLCCPDVLLTYSIWRSVRLPCFRWQTCSILQM